jgi:aconitate hydratase
MKQNLATKIIQSHLAKPAELKAGGEIYLKIDETLTHDINAVMADLAFEALEIKRVKPDICVSYLDHNLLYVDSKTPDDHIYLQSFAKKFGLWVSRPGNGICHALQTARFNCPGKVLLGSDSHTSSGGAIGSLSIGAGGMDIATAMAGFPFRLKMPQIIKVNLTGRLNPGVSAKDIALEMLRINGVKGGLGKIFEFSGPGVKTLEVPQRITISNMMTETGATTAIFPGDERVEDFFKAQKREKDFVSQLADEGCSYDGEIDIDLDSLTPLAACPHSPDNIKKVKDLGNVKVQQVFIGSCTNASYSDIAKAAAVMKGHVVNEDVSLTVAVSTRQNYEKLMQDGYIKTLLEAGARFTELACGACCGVGQVPATKGVSVRTSNRNFKGRGGSADAFLYLVSPEVAAASAISGYLTEPSVILGGSINILSSIKEPLEYPVNDNLFIKPLPQAEAETIEIIRGPNIKPLPVCTPLPETLTMIVSLKAGDNVTTDDITPASAQFSSMRSNMPAMAEYAFSRYDPDFVKRAKEAECSAIIGGENYGQGSSREHAAITPMYLGVRVVLVKSMARIHKANLINHGPLPLLFKNPADYDAISLGDELVIENAPSQLRSGKISIKDKTKGREIEALADLSDEEREIIIAGGQLRYLRGKMRSKEA